MIEINLLPGDGKKKKKAKTSAPTKFEFNLKPPPWLAGLTQKITDKYMLGAVAAAGASGALIVLMFISQAARGALLDARDMWSHLMYEISNALPQYTWLREITQTSQPRSVAMADTTVKKAGSDTAGSAKSPRERAAERDRAKKARGDSLLAAAKEVKFKIVGHTVD